MGSRNITCGPQTSCLRLLTVGGTFICQLFPTRQTGVAERHAFNLFSLKHSLVQTTLVAVLTLGSGIGWAWGLSMGKMERYFFVAAATSFLTLIAAIALLELMPS